MSKVHSLSNGVQIVIDHMPSLETAALGVWAHAGSVDERDNEHGVAHLLEHMAFKGTRRRTARSLAEEIESVGGYLNAATSHQRTGYYARILKDDLAIGVDILSDILLHPLFDDSELAKEQEVVVQEIGEAADTPDDVVFELLMEACWAGASLARPILGTPQTVRAQSPDSLREYMRRCYGPGDLVVAAAGNVDENFLLPLVEKHFGGVRKSEPAPSRPVPEFRGGVRHNDREIEQTHLALAFPGVCATDKDFFATRIYADVLGGGMSSRLFQSIREERGLAYSVYAFSDSFEQCGLTGAYVSADESQIVEAASIICKEMEAMSSAVSQIEIDRARALLRASLMMALESPAVRIEAAAGQIFTFDRLTQTDEIIRQLEAVSIEDVKRCAERALSGLRSIALVGPGNALEIEKTLSKH